MSTAFARWKLEIARIGPFTVRELALLANMSEGAVRNAISKRELRASKDGTSTQIDRMDALDWIADRQGFVAMPPSPSDGQSPIERLLGAETPDGFGSALRETLQSHGRSVEDVASDLGWSGEQSALWLSGETARVFGDAARLARLLGLEDWGLYNTLMRIGLSPPK